MIGLAGAEQNLIYISKQMGTLQTLTDLYPETAAIALEYQDFIMAEMFKRWIIINYYGGRSNQYNAESLQGYEIKYDRKSETTNNICVEFAEKKASNKRWIPSGICKVDNTWCIIIGNYKECWWLNKKGLSLLKDRMWNERGVVRSGSINWQNVPDADRSGMNYYETETSRGFIIPKNDPIMDLYCIRHIVF